MSVTVTLRAGVSREYLTILSSLNDTEAIQMFFDGINKSFKSEVIKFLYTYKKIKESGGNATIESRTEGVLKITVKTFNIEKEGDTILYKY